MHAPWQSFREELRASLRSKRHVLPFRRLRASLPSELTTPDHVIRFLDTRDGDEQARARVLRLLVDRVQAREADAETAFAMLALGRWRDLDAIYERWRRGFRRDPTEVVSRIREGFTRAVLAMDTTRSSNPEASLRLSTQRPLVEWWARVKRERDAERPEWVPGPEAEVQATPDLSPAGLPRSMSSAARMAFLQGIARQAAGEDAEIVFAVDLCEEEMRDVAARLGITVEAAKKRYQRAKARIAKAFREM